MEQENICSSLPDETGSVIQQPKQTSIGNHNTDREQQIPTNNRTDQLSLFPNAGRDPQQWVQMIWPVCHMASTNPLLPFATVQWDLPDPTAEESSLMTTGSVANKLESGFVTSLDNTSSLLDQFQEINAELFTQKGREEGDWFDPDPLNSNLERTGNSSEPCDAANVQEPTAQEDGNSAHELLSSNYGLPLTMDSEQEKRHSATNNSVETMDLVDILEDTEGSEDEAYDFSYLKLEEEQEEAAVLLIGEGDSENTQTSRNGLETEEEQSEANVSCSEESEMAKVSCRNVVEVPAGPTGNADKQIDLQQSELLPDSGSEEEIKILERLHEDPTGQSKQSVMCKDVTQQTAAPESEAVMQDYEEVLAYAADNPERTDISQELMKKLENLSCLQHKDCDRMSSQKLLLQSEQSQRIELSEEPEQIQTVVSHQVEVQHLLQRLLEPRHVELSTQMELRGESTRADQPEDCALSEQMVCVEAEDPEVAEQQEQTEPAEQNEQTDNLSQQMLPERPEETDESEDTEQLSARTEVATQSVEAKFNQVDKQSETSHEAKEVGGSEAGPVQTSVANGEQPSGLETAAPLTNEGGVDREMAQSLAERLYKLDGIKQVDVVKHIDKDNHFSHAVGEEYLKFFDFTGQTLDHALRSFLKVVVLIGETQERERVLQHFSNRFLKCNPDSFTSSGAALALTCALMLLNTDLHGQNLGKSMSSSKFVSNLDGMNEGENFSRDILKSHYNSIKSEPLEWALNEEDMKSCVLMDEDSTGDMSLRSKVNPFQDLPHDRGAHVVKEGFLQRKLHADIDGKRTPWGKRGWKTYYGLLRGMVLYLHKDDYRKDQQTSEEAVSVHHCLAQEAADYTKKPHVLRLQTADCRVFLFQASSKMEMNSWISRINLVSALHSSPPFPAAVGSQRRFFRPILPAIQSAHTLEHQLQSHSKKFESFKTDLLYLETDPPGGKKAKAKELVEHRVREEYLQHEMCRYDVYIQVLEAWKIVKKTDDDILGITYLLLFDKAMCGDSMGEEDEQNGMKKSHSSPSLELEILPKTVVKVKRNISERRTYRRPITTTRWYKEV